MKGEGFMQVKDEELSALIELQNNDMELLRVRKAIADLPQRKTIVAARKKIASIEEKRQAVEKLRAAAEEKLSKFTDEDEHLAEKQRAAQEAVDASKGYRDVEARTKEMDGYAKRRATIEEELDKLSGELSKIESIEKQISAALDTLHTEEASEAESFQREGGELKKREAERHASHDAIAQKLPDELRARYERTARQCGGVAVAMLANGTCGACRAPIEQGRLIDLKAHAPLGECPNCKRMLIVLPSA